MTTTAAIRNRRITTDLPIGVTADGFRVVAAVSSYHSREGRQLVASLTRVTIHTAGTAGAVVRSVTPSDFVRVTTDPIARYSDKALSAFHEDVLAIVERFRDSREWNELNAIFAPVAA
jgi:hypothetical protein